MEGVLAMNPLWQGAAPRRNRAGWEGTAWEASSGSEDCLKLATGAPVLPWPMSVHPFVEAALFVCEAACLAGALIGLSACSAARRDAEDAVRGRDGYDFGGNSIRVELSRGGMSGRFGAPTGGGGSRR